MNSNPSKFALKFWILQYIEWNKQIVPLMNHWLKFVIHIIQFMFTCMYVARDQLLPKAECEVYDDHDDWNSSKGRPE